VGAIIERAKAIALELEEAGTSATHDVRNIKPPCVLVVPIPDLTYTDGTLGGSHLVTWTLWALARGPGDLAAAEALETLVDDVSDVIPIETAEAGAYKIPGSSDPLPGYKLTMNEYT
jgi:hypothetical protein